MPLERVDFETELRNFCEKWQMLDDQVPWKICQSDSEIYARQSTLVSTTDEQREILSREAHIVYNNIYKVPVMWFNFFKRDGTPIQLDQLPSVILIDPNESRSSLMTRISHNEHPYLGVLYYNVHPCNTENVMSELLQNNADKNSNYIFKWLSIYGSEIGISMPLASTKSLFDQKS